MILLLHKNNAKANSKIELQSHQSRNKSLSIYDIGLKRVNVKNHSKFTK